MCPSLRLAPDVSLAHLARMTPGYVGADLKSLITMAIRAGVRR